jgi:MurNAc alpha-1-phosphate uridylyltransferase
MKVMILAAGRGERLRPLTDHTPKPLVHAGNQRIIEYLIDALVQSGFKDIVINYAHLGEQFPQALGDGKKYGAHITYSPELDGGLETAGGIINALPLLGDEPFLVVNGDIWTDYDFSKLSGFELESTSVGHLVMVNNPAHNTSGDFALNNEGQVRLDGDPKFTFSGIGIYRPSLFAGLDNSKRPLKPIFNQAIAEQKLSGELYQGEWSDIGTLERLQQLEDSLP